MRNEVVALKHKADGMVAIGIPISVGKVLVLVPLIIRSPSVYLSSPPTMFNIVVFPQPDGPKMETNSLFLKLKETPFNA